MATKWTPNRFTHNTIPASKIPSFLLLMDKIAAEKGSIKNACEFAEISKGDFSCVKNGIKPLTPYVAEKILKAYKSMKVK